MQIIVAGCGKVGVNIVDQLSKEGHDITIIDTRSDVIKNLSSLYDVQGVVGSAISIEVLTEAGIDSADLLVAVTNSDELNLLCCVIAKKYKNVQTIARVRNHAYSKQGEFLKEQLGLAMIINPEYAAAGEILKILRFPSAIEIDTFSKGRMELLKFRIGEGSELADLRIIDAVNKLKCNVLFCSVQRGDDVIIPKGDVILREKDVVSIVASPQDSVDFFQKIGILTHRVKSTMIVGGGEISYYLARLLISSGVKVKIIEKNKTRCEELSELLPQAMIICGDGTDKNLLIEEGIERTESFVALTNIDEENVLLSLYAMSKTKGKTITKINSISFDEIINRLNLDSIVYPKHITSEYIIQYARAMQNSIGSNIETLYKLCDGKVEALEFFVNEDSQVTNTPLMQMNLKPNLLICSINHENQIKIPRGSDKIFKGDKVIVVTTQTGLKDIKDILK